MLVYIDVPPVSPFFDGLYHLTDIVLSLVQPQFVSNYILNIIMYIYSTV